MSGIVQQTRFLGFGEYQIDRETIFDHELIRRTQHLFFSVLNIFLMGISIAQIPTYAFFATAAAVGFCCLAVRSIWKLAASFYRAPNMQGLFSEEVEEALPACGALSENCTGGIAASGRESHQMKLDLIRQATRSIFISGCYAGGNAFDEVLDLILDRMEQNQRLTVHILASDMFINEENRMRIDSLKQSYSNRFYFEEVPEVFPMQSPTTDELSLSTNHTKALIIDYGRAFMTGGSGIVNTWAEQEGVGLPATTEPLGVLYDEILKIEAFRDMDFIFTSEQNGVGTRVYVEMMKLFHRFKYHKPEQIEEVWSERIQPADIPMGIPELQVACYTSGPESPNDQFLREIIDQVKTATRSITIGHLYFHPPKELLDALVAATNRGIEITLITNELSTTSPGAHMSYASLSRYWAKRLFEGKPKPNVAFYEYQVPYTTYHKKVIVIDHEITLLGSSNLGFKSLSSLDYEMNFKVKSPDFATRTLQSIEEDKQFCVRVENPEISLATWVLSTLQSVAAPFV